MPVLNQSGYLAEIGSILAGFHRPKPFDFLNSQCLGQACGLIRPFEEVNLLFPRQDRGVWV